MLIWPIPLWYRAWYVHLNACEIIGWYVIAAMGHYGGIGCGLYYLAHGPWYCKMIMPCAVFFYYLSITSLWLWYMNKVSSVWNVSHQCERVDLKAACIVMMWVLLTLIYIVFITDYSLIICGAKGGYVLFSPLIPLVHAPWVLLPLQWCSERFLLLMMLLLQGAFTWCLIQKRFVMLLMIGGLVGLGYGFTYAIRMEKSLSLEHDYSRLGVITSQFFDEDVARLLRHVEAHVQDMCNEHPSCNCVLLPESSMYTPDVLPIVNSDAIPYNLARDIVVIAGGFRTEGTSVFNTIWFISQGKVVDYFDKQYVLPVTEQNMHVMKWLGGGHTFTYATFPIEPGCKKRERPLWEVTPGLCVVPYICSELFLARYPRDRHHGAVVLALCNNSWAPLILRQMMLRAAMFRALQWQRTIIYVAHSYASVIMKNGIKYPLVQELHVCAY